MSRNKRPLLLVFLLTLSFAAGCHPVRRSRAAAPPPSTLKPLPVTASPQLKLTIQSAIDQTNVTTGYDPSYVKIDYPNGDVPEDRGVCADVIVRAFRKGGIDLQKQVHEDMKDAWADYPKKWRAGGPDANIDHRRVLNLMTYFERQGESLPVSANADDYLPGDVVTWDLASGLDHIGIVVNQWADKEKRYLMVHNVGAGTKVEDVLFAWKITGHYRHFK
jgi:uncharacterized protein YijF (DUF1287 family)